MVEADRERDVTKSDLNICQQYKGVGQTGEDTQGERQTEKRNERDIGTSSEASQRAAGLEKESTGCKRRSLTYT